MSQLVKSKSQMGGTLVSAFYERSEEDNDNGEILSIAHAVEVTPEYQPLKPYSKEFRNRVDDISKRRQFKDEAFNGKNTIEDIECQKKNYDIESSVQIGYLSKLEEKRDSLQERVNAKAQQTASAYGVSVSTLMSSFSSAGVVQYCCKFQ